MPNPLSRNIGSQFASGLVDSRPDTSWLSTFQEMQTSTPMKVRYEIFVFLAWLCGATAGAQESVRWVWADDANGTTTNNITRLLERLNEQAPSFSGTISLKKYFANFPVHVRIDEKALEEENITPDEPMYPPHPDESIRSYLEWVLGNLQLTWVPTENSLLVTSKKSSANVLCLYDVTPVVPNVEITLKQELYYGNPNTHSLSLMIEQSIAPDQWQNSGGTSSISSRRVGGRSLLAINAPFTTQVEVQQLFASQD